jgi:hypothetical protein
VSFLDSAKEKLQELADDNPDQVEQLSDQAITHGGDAVDRVTDGSRQLCGLRVCKAKREAVRTGYRVRRFWLPRVMNSRRPRWSPRTNR